MSSVRARIEPTPLDPEMSAQTTSLCLGTIPAIANWPLKIDVLKIHNCFTEITKGVSVNLFKISEMSVTIR